LVTKDLLVLIHLRTGQPYAQVEAKFGISNSTAWRHLHEVMEFLVIHASTVYRALQTTRVRGEQALVLDGTLIPIARLAADRPFYSGKLRWHGVNL